jgi:hypothetical protein
MVRFLRFSMMHRLVLALQWRVVPTTQAVRAKQRMHLRNIFRLTAATKTNTNDHGQALA